MKNPLKKHIGARFSLIFTVALSLWAVQPAFAANDYWAGVPGSSADTNWTTTANWTSAQQTYFNAVFFNGVGTNANNNYAVNNVLNATTGVAQMPMYELDYVPTNGNYTTLINPGVTMTIGAGDGNLRAGAGQGYGVTSHAVPANAVETITITGSGGTLTMNGNLTVGQGSTTPNDTHNVTLDLSGLDNFVMTANNNYIYLASTGGNNSPLLNGVLYLAKTNNIVLGQGIQICNQSSSSNSLPVALYLGISNLITLGSSGNFNIGQGGVSTNGVIVAFNPAFLGGATPPTAVFNSAASGGRIGNLYVCNTSQSIPGYALCNLSGGSVNALVSTLQVGQSSSGLGAATGVLTFDMGAINANSAYIGRQQSSGGGMAVGAVNINSNSTYGASATLQVNTLLTLAATTGTVTPGTAGTLNVNGGTLIANLVTNGGGVGTINLTNATWQVSLTPGVTAYGNITVTNFNTGGPTNSVVVSFATLPSTYPVTNRLVVYQSLGGAGIANLGLTLPTGGSYAGYLTNNTAANAIDLIVTAGDVPIPLVWTGTDPGSSPYWDTAALNWTNLSGTRWRTANWTPCALTTPPAEPPAPTSSGR